MARKDDALGDGAAWDEPEAANAPRRDRRRGVFITAAGAGLALALVGGLLFVQRGEADDEAASAPVALSPDGLSPHVSAEQLAAGMPVARRALDGTLAAPAKADTKIPATQVRAYRRAEATLTDEHATCRLGWSLLAAIGKVESNHAADRNIPENGDVTPLVRGPRLDGSVIGTQMVLDTDQGFFDQDPQFDRAMGPMQFVPGTWRIAGRDGNGDGKVSPDNAFDAALTAANYLCSAGEDLSTEQGLTAAVLRYNNHPKYLEQVLAWSTYYGSHLKPAKEAPAPPSNATVPTPPAPTVAPTTPAVTPTPTVPSTGPTPPNVPITVPSTTSPVAPAVPAPAVPTKGTSATKTPAPATPTRTTGPTSTTTAPAPSTSTSQAPSTPTSHTTTSEAPAPVTTPKETPTSSSPSGSSSSSGSSGSAGPVSPAEPTSSASSTHTQSVPRAPSTPAEPSSASGVPTPTGSDLPPLPDDPTPSGTSARSSR